LVKAIDLENMGNIAFIIDRRKKQQTGNITFLLVRNEFIAYFIDVAEYFC